MQMNDAAPHDGLEPYRTKINRIDNQIIDLLAERMGICAEVALYKQRYNIDMMQPGRIKAVKTRCAERARAQGMREQFIHDLYDMIIAEACVLETRIIEET